MLSHVRRGRARPVARALASLGLVASLGLSLEATAASAASATGSSPSTTLTAHSTHKFQDCGPWRRVRTARVNFLYPSCWNVKTYPAGGHNWLSLAYVSNRSMHYPCIKVRNSAIPRLDCTWPLTRLRRNSILISWALVGSPGLSVAHQPGTSLTLRGSPAKELVTTGDVCGVLHATVEFNLAIATSTPDNLVEMTACLNGPSLGPQQSLLQRMIKSIRMH